MWARRSWACSGTPISTEVADFLGQFKFLGVAPFSVNAYFTNYVRAPAAQPDALPAVAG